MKGRLRDVIEVPHDTPDGTLRLMYTVKIAEDIYVLDFRIEQRLKHARALAAEIKKAKNS